MRFNGYKKFILFMLLFSTAVYAQSITKTGTTAASFLKIGVGSRAIGMGGAFTANSYDISSMYWNPGALANISGNEALFSHVEWFADINYDYAAFASEIPGFGALGAFVSVLSTDEMPVRTIEKPNGTGEYFDYGTLAVGLCYSRSLTENFSVGANVKYINEKLWNMSANGFALDIGTLYRIHVLNELRIAASISNFGTKMRLEGRDILHIIQTGANGGNLLNTNLELDEFDLPLMFRFGLAADFLKTDNMRLTVETDAVHPNDHTEYVNAGTEYSWKETFFVRAGYKSIFEENTEQGLTLGAGINYRLNGIFSILMDYAYQDFGRLKDVHYMTVGLRF
ncbi:MAG: PorV/PorQ family protein [Bacteroidota bacterium]